jgi:hypothetical protein
VFGKLTPTLDAEAGVVVVSRLRQVGDGFEEGQGFHVCVAVIFAQTVKMRKQNQDSMDDTPPPEAHKPSSVRHLRRATVWMLEALGVALAGVIILAGVLAFRLSQGPLPLNFLSPYVADALQGIDPGIDVAIGETVVIWSQTAHTLQLRARDVRVRATGGEERAAVPEISVALSMPALLHGMLAPSSLEVQGLKLRLIRTADGKIQFGSAATPPAPASGEISGEALPDQMTTEATPAETTAPIAPEQDQGPVLSDDAVKNLVGLFAGTSDSNQRASYLRRIEVQGAEVVIEDQKAGHVWRAPEAHLAIVRDQSGAEAQATLAVELNDAHPKLDIHIHYTPGDTALAVETHLSDLDPAALAAAISEPVAEPLGALEAPLTGVVHASVGLDGTIESVRLSLDIAAGQIFFKRLDLSDSDDGVPFDDIHLDVHFSDDLNTVTVDRLNIDLPTAQLSLTGEATLSTPVPEVHFEAQTALLPVPTLIRYWPEKVAEHAREWVAKNLEDGNAENVHFLIDLGPKAPTGKFDVTGIDGDFRVKDAKVAFFRPLPSGVGLSATAKFTTDTLSFDIDGGTVGGLTVDGGTVTINGMNVHDQDLAVEAVAHGSLASTFEILDNPRLGFIKQLGIKADEAGGDMATRLRVAMPLNEHIPFDDVEIQANSNLRGASIPRIALGLDVTDGDMSLIVDKKGLSLQGKAKVGGENADVSLEENFDKDASFLRRVYYKGTLGDDARETAGITLPYVSGPVAAEAFITQYNDGRADVDVTADLSASTVTLADFGWSKDPGEPGTAVVRGKLRNDKLYSIDEIEARSGDLTASGRLHFAPDGKTIQSAVMPRIVFGENDIRANVSRNAKGAYVFRVQGPKFNVEPMLSAHDDDDNAEPGPAMIVDVTLDYARLGKGGGAKLVTGHLERDGKHWNVMTIDGEVAPSKMMSIRMSPDDNNGRTFSVSASDSGALLKEMDVTGNVIGGTLKLDGRYDDSDPHSPFKGKLELRSFHLERAPLLAKVLSVASLTGILNALGGQGIDFSAFDANLTYVNGTAYTDDLLAHGSAIGFTGRGNVDLRGQTIDLQGTVVPAYSLNSVLGNIPLLGSILTGPEGGGVFAANYRMRGAIADPDVSVNPLSTLAPGILRNIFNIFDKPAPSAPPKTAPAPPAEDRSAQ